MGAQEVRREIPHKPPFQDHSSENLVHSLYKVLDAELQHYAPTLLTLPGIELGKVEDFWLRQSAAVRVEVGEEEVELRLSDAIVPSDNLFTAMHYKAGIAIEVRTGPDENDWQDLVMLRPGYLYMADDKLPLNVVGPGSDMLGLTEVIFSAMKGKLKEDRFAKTVIGIQTENKLKVADRLERIQTAA